MQTWRTIALGWAVAGSALAVDTVQFTGDGNLGDYLVAGSEQAIGEMRYGNGALNGDWEIGVGADTQVVGQFDQAQFAWGNGTSESFSLSWDGSTLDLMVGATSTSYLVGAVSVTDVLIRTAGSVGNSAMLENLVVNGDAVGIDVGVGDAASDAEYLGLLDVFANPFSLTGDVTFAWSDEDSLRGSRPSVQFKIGTVVPEPTSGLLVLVGLLGLRRR